MMKAALLKAGNSPVEISKMERPEPAYDEVLVKVEVCGLCHTDLHIINGDWKLPLLPLVPGHEVVGTVTEMGAGVKHLAIGDRVGVAWLHQACQVCDLCVQGREMFCEAQTNTGYTVQGGFAEYIKANANFVVKIPAELSSGAAATILCAGVTPYRALKESRARAGETVALFGIGGLGHLAIQIAKVMGLRVIAVDVSEEKLATAREHGADVLVDASKVAPGKYISKQEGGAHAAVNFVMSGNTMSEAFFSLRRCGTLVAVGLPREDFTLPVIQFVGRGINVVGSVVGTRQDLREVLALAAAGKVVPQITEKPLDQINDVLKEMHDKKLAGRCVMRIE